MFAPLRIAGRSPARNRLLVYLLVVALAILGYTLLYRVGLAVFEGVRVGYLKALLTVVESMTTTGYGEDAATWSSPWTFALLVAMQLTGVGLIFITLPLFLVPLVEEALRTDPSTETDLTDHVILCGFSSRGETLVEELDSVDLPYVVVEPDRDRAVDLEDRGYDVVHGHPEEVAVLRAAGASEAVALVADEDDETNASVILSARQIAPDLRVVSVVTDATAVDYHRYAGADRVVRPRRVLGESLASKAATAVRTEVDDAIRIGREFEVAELLVRRDSRLAGQTVAETRLDELGVNVIGAWFRGEFVSPPRPDDVIDAYTVLLVAGHPDQLEELKGLTLSEARRHRRGTVVVAGHGDVGSTVTEGLAAADVPTVVVDVADRPGVDVVGDVADRRTLERAEVDDARTVVLALSDDTATVYATLAVKQFAPDVEVIARANDASSVEKLYRAGAEYVLALSTVSGRILASAILDEEVLSPDTKIEVVRTTAPKLVGETLGGADVRAETGCTVVAVERDGELLTDVGPSFEIREGDLLFVAGPDRDINRFNELAAAD